MTKQDFINLIAPAAIEAYKKHGILPSLILAQAALESHWGKSAPGCMLFGIKWTKDCGFGWQLLWTKEFINGKWVKVRARFRKYNSYVESIADHVRLLLNPRYSKARVAKDYKEACKEVWKAGYATDPDYPVKLIRLIEDYNLNKWDGGNGDEMVRYQSFADVPDPFRGTIKILMDAGIIVGCGNGIVDLSHDQIRTLIFMYRGGGFDRKLIKAGLKPAVE